MSKIGLGDKYDLLPVTSVQVAGIRVFPRGALDDYDHAASLGVPTTGLSTEERRGAAAASGRAVKQLSSGKKVQVLPPTGIGDRPGGWSVASTFC